MKNFAKMTTVLLSCALMLAIMLSSPTYAMFSGSRALLKSGKEVSPRTVRGYSKHSDFSYDKQTGQDLLPTDEEGPEFYNSLKPSNFTQKAWWKVKPIYAQIKQHPFIRELATGSLSRDIFSFYIKQDHLFLIERAQAMSILSSRSANAEHATYLGELAKYTKKGADEIFEKYQFTKPFEKDLIKSPACRAYTEYMLASASKGSFQEGFIALLPCTLLYQKIGEFCKASSPSNNDYKLWIENYSSSERRQGVIKFIGVSNELADQSSSEELTAIETVFLRASQFEYDFWDDAYYQKQ